MPKISDEKLTRICFRLWTEDFRKAKFLSDRANKHNKVLRAVIHNFFNRSEVKVRRDLNRILENSK